MDWKTETLDDGREIHRGVGPSGHSLRVYDWRDGRVFWSVSSPDGNMGIDEGCAASVEEAKGEVERALEKLGGKHRPADL